MANCPNCGNQVAEKASFCTSCGASLTGNGGGQNNTAASGGYYQAQNQYAAPVDPFDHTREFTAQDISDNKIFAMLGYLFGLFGILVSLLAVSAGKSEYVMFHVRQSLKFVIFDFLLGVASLVLFVTVIVPIAGVILGLVLFVIKLISFFQVCSGLAKEPAIIRSLPFLK